MKGILLRSGVMIRDCRLTVKWMVVERGTRGLLWHFVPACRLKVKWHAFDVASVMVVERTTRSGMNIYMYIYRAGFPYSQK